MKKHKGAVLIFTLLMLFVMSLLVLSAVETNLLERKMTTAMSMSAKLEAAGEIALIKIESLLKNNEIKTCMKDDLGSDYFFKNDRQFWQSQSTCMVGMNDYRTVYVVEKLATVSCVDVMTDPKTEAVTHGAQFYRITAHTQHIHHNQANVIQAHYALPSEKSLTCLASEARKITIGRQSWIA